MSPESFADIRPDLERLVVRRSQQDHCSIAWGVVAHGELVLTGACAAEPDPMPTPRTVFRIASMTKSFTAAAILILRDRGALRLDDPVAHIVPEFSAVVGPTSDSPPITIRHLLSMAAGMVTDDMWADRHLDVSDDDVDELLASGATFAWPPQLRGEYSNLGFAMLGRVIQRASGRRAQQFITENLLLQLGMHRTTWKQPNHDDWARPYVVRDDLRVADIAPLSDGAFAPMGGLWSCVADLARWVAWLADAFPPRDGDESGPLCRASRRDMQQVQRSWPTVHTPANGEGDDSTPERIDGGGYGFGLFVTHDDRFGHFVAHSGGLPGYGSNMRWLPGRGIGVIALGNVTYAPMTMLARRMLEVVDDHGLAAAVPIRPSPALEAAAHGLALLLSDWTEDAAEELFADNVDLDESFSRRAGRAAELVAARGTLTLLGIEAETAMRGRATMRCTDGTDVKIDLDLSPVVPPRIQFYEVVTG
ncbi:MAG TPA: serine hydrolase domain-containing protein [Ilumatobacteraceae bacterium]|nr:serine hydrolase domain-containing protein [Ilumatobacteraceae bacterium]